MANEEKVIPVIVAIRARPLSTKEIDEGSSTCLDFFVENGQVNINSKPFYFDHVFDSNSKQESVYDMCAEPLIEKLFEGYNCTIFAYGQTGSGKTFTMGTECCDFTIDSDRKGMIPRIVEAIFARADSDDESEIIVKCSMLEIYEERVLDLLSDKSEKPELFIREHPQEGIFVQNLCQVQVGDSHQTMQQLAQGCLSRTKGGTAMNSESSRSHAIFTIFVKKLMKSDSGTRFCFSKLHLVDLAGSERLKKTQAQGERKKEGIKINEGLLALGNVISALTDSTQQRSHIPYRDSKLTRLLQDSLGGNTYTVMITCVSPADSNYDETLNSLRYAERAKKIKNKPTVNEDPNAREICDLRKKLDEMQKQLLEYQLRNRLDSQEPSFDSSVLMKFKQEIDNLKFDNVNLSDRLTQMVIENGSLIEKIARTECQRDKLKDKLSDLQQNFDINVTQLENQFTNNNLDDSTVRIAQNENLKAYIEKCKDVQKKLQDLQNDEALLLQEASFEKGNEENDEEFDEEKFISRHSAASKQLEHLLKQITDKEKLIKDSAMNMEQFEQLKADHQREIGDLKEKINAVQKEKKELESQLVSVGKTSKISENRRKKMAELEKQLTDYKKKLLELQKFEKMKQQNDQAIAKMKEEVTALKQQRVHLTRQLRVDKQLFTEWQNKAEKQMNQMKVKEKRREYEAILAKRNFDQQLNVHRRKYEEAVALSKRLQVQLQRQNTVKKNQFSEGQETDKLRNEIKDFLDKEIELLASTEEAKLCCDNLLKQRSNLNQQLKSYEKQFNRLLKNPKIANDENPQSDYIYAGNLQEKIESLRKEVLLRTNEIQELRQKISSLDAAQMEEKRWNNLNTIVQVKCAMKTLFSMAVAFRTDYLQIEHRLADLHANFDLLNDVMKEKEKKINDLERQCAERERVNENRFNKLNMEHNNKIASFLSIFSKLESSQLLDNEMKKLMQLCGEEAEKLQILTEKLDEKDLENEKLTKELSKAKVRGGAHGKYFQHVSSTRKRKSSDRKKIESGLIKVNNNGEDDHVKRSRSSRVIKRPARFGSFANPDNLTAFIDDSVTEGNVDDGTSSTENHSPGTAMVLAYIDDDAADEDYRETPIHKQKTRMFTFNEAPIVSKMNDVNDEEQAPLKKKSVKNKTVNNKLFAPMENFLNSTFVTATTSSSLNVDSAVPDFIKTSTPNNAAAVSTKRLEIPFLTTPAVVERAQMITFAKPAVPTPQILMRGLTAPNSYQKFSPNRKVPLFKPLTPSLEPKK